ncbi:MAG: hypothetical protein QNJ97_28250 [Myxococcota bacterium]|nr:hypothetical protein [Myxococcota bacterium]
MFSLLCWAVLGCGDDDDSDPGGDADTDSDSDSDTDSDSDADTDSDSDSDADPGKNIGDPCTCEGTGCEQDGFDVPIPNGGTIIGCENVPSGLAGSELVCLRSYVGNAANDTFFANGFCSLMATDCDGNQLICDNAAFGAYADMAACPAGNVLLTYDIDVQVELVPGQALEATVSNKTCTPSCQVEGDCRESETDPVLNQDTQYACLDKDGIKFCFDPRGLPTDYTAEQF